MRPGHPAPAVLITRPEPGAAETARRLAALGWQPVAAPALVLMPRRFALPRNAQALLLTSRAAARTLPPGLPPGLPLVAVGAATAAEARAHGGVNVIAAEGDAMAMAGLIASRFNPQAGPLLLAVGAGYGQDLAISLRGQGFRVLRRIAYAATPAADLPANARQALAGGQIVAALFFSPRSARCAISLMQAAGLAATATSIEALAISPRVAEAASAALAPLSWRAVRVAGRPDQDSLLQLLGPR